MTIEQLKAYGANTDEALGRCFGNEAFYFKLVNMVRMVIQKRLDMVRISMNIGKGKHLILPIL